MPKSFNLRTATNRWLTRTHNFFTKQPNSKEEFISTLQHSHYLGVIDDDALDIMEGAIRLMDMQARDIMIPYSQMRTLSIEQDREACLQIITETGHSRFPVIDNDNDEIIGIALAKDFIRSSTESNEFDLQNILRNPSIIPESKRLSVLLREFREQRYHMAIVIDEYGGISGLITIEDILEEIVGEIEDETDEEEVNLIQVFNTDQGQTYLIQTQLNIEDFNESFNCGLSDDDFDTIGGLLLQQFGRVPLEGDCICIENFKFTVISADERRIISAKLEVILAT